MSGYESVAGREVARFLVAASFHDPELGRFLAGTERDLIVDEAVRHLERARLLVRVETYPDPEVEQLLTESPPGGSSLNYWPPPSGGRVEP